MSASFILKSVLIGFFTAIPIGPMGILCIRRNLAGGRRTGLIAGAGIAFGDFSYALLAALSLAGFSQFLLRHDLLVHVVTGFILILLGLKFFFSHSAPPDLNVSAENTSSESDKTGSENSDFKKTTASIPGPFFNFISAWLLTLGNPMVIIAYAAIFAAVSMHTELRNLTAPVAAIGVFCGSFLWWLLLSLITHRFKHAFTRPVCLWLDRISGLFVGLFGLIEIILGFL